MWQGLFNLTVSLYIVISSIAFGGLYKRIDLLQQTDKSQIEFNDEVIKGFNIMREGSGK